MEKAFHLSRYGTTVRRELLAGITTFLTMSYILAVNPAMLGQIGGGMTPEAVFTGTAIASAIATLVMAFAANLPIALAPGMGLNAFFTFTVVMGMGFPWQIALTAIFLEGAVFFVLSLFDIRKAIINAIPANLKIAIPVGIGLFIALIGFVNAGIVVNDSGTAIVGLGDLTDTHPLLALAGFVIIIVLYTLKVPGAVFIGVLTIAVIGIPLGVTSVPSGWSPVGTPSAPVFFQLDFSAVLTFKFFNIFLTFFLVSVFDTVGTLAGITAQAGLIGKNGYIPRGKQAFIARAVGTMTGAVFGTSSCATYVESSAGVAVGGRTGLASLCTGVLFLLALVFAPIFLLVSSSATAPALIFVGFLMMTRVVDINFKDPTEGIPAFMTIVMMPFTYSISQGITYGILSYVLLKAATGKFREIPLLTWALFVVFALAFFIN